MASNAIDSTLRKLDAEIRAIASQNLSTDAGMVKVSAGADGSISGIPANDSQFRDYKVIITFTPSGTGGQTPMTNCWLYNLHVPANDWGFDNSALIPVQTSPTTYEIICPFIGINISDTFSFSAHISGLSAGTVRLTNGGPV